MDYCEECAVDEILEVEPQHWHCTIGGFDHCHEPIKTLSGITRICDEDEAAHGRSAHPESAPSWFRGGIDKELLAEIAHEPPEVTDVVYPEHPEGARQIAHAAQRDVREVSAPRGKR